MPVVIGCPKCKTKYKLPDGSLGKAIKCKACGANFQTKAPSSTPAPARPSASSEDLAKFGLDKLKQQPDLFAATPQAPRKDILGNLAADPGFAEVDFEANEVEEVRNTEGAELFPNHALESRSKKAKPADDEPATGKKKRKKKKPKMHPLVKESLDKATMTLFVVGVLMLLVFGFIFFSAKHDASANVANQVNALEDMDIEIDEDDAEFAAEINASAIRFVSGVGMGLGGVFIALGVGIQFFPVTCSIMALLFYCGLELMMLIMNPFGLVSFLGWIRRIAITGALGKALMDAMNARSYEKSQADRAARRRR